MADESQEKEDKKEKTDEEILTHIQNPETKKKAGEWLAQQHKRAGEWQKIDNGGKPDPKMLNEVSQEDSHLMGEFESVMGHPLAKLEAYSRADDMTENEKNPGVLAGYLRLIMAHEILIRLKDGRVVLMGMHPLDGPILASAGTPEKREKESKNKKSK